MKDLISSTRRQSSWEQRINDLKAFKKEHGHCNVPRRYSLNSALGWWLADIRKRKELGKLDEKTIQFLDALGVCWKWQTTWKQRINDLKAFKKEHGHCNVPQKYQPNPVLGKWVANVGQRKRLGVLTEDKVLCLDALGFSWARRPHAVMASWKQRINDLKAFKKEYGHCNVPSIYQPNLALGHWVAKMRQWKKRGKLAEDKILILDGLGFVWAIKQRGVLVSWEQRITDLKAFKKEHGHCKVPNKYQPNPALGKWVCSLRQSKKHGTLAEDKTLTLDGLGFCWEAKLAFPAVQKQRINDLKAFKNEHGHCNVPQKYQPNPALSRWVANVRQWKKRGTLAEDKILSLDALGFVWEGLKKGRPKQR